MSRISIGLAQLECAPLDVSENARRTAAALRSAAAQGASLVVLPELAATGYVLEPAELAARAESTDSPGPVLGAWSREARDLGITVVGGFVEGAGDRLFNSVAVVGPDGDLAGVYRKLHLFGREREVFEPGDLGLPVVEVGGLRLGLLVCYDLRFPETVRILALRDVDLIAVPTAWVAGFDAAVPEGPRIGQVDAALVHGNLNSVFLACADQVGAAGGFTFLGRSLLVDPYGRAVVGPLDPREPAVVVVPVDLADARAARHRGPGISPLDDRRTDVYGELLGYRDPAAVPSFPGGPS